MGPYRRDASRGGGCQLTGIVRVVPDVPSFSVDDGFAYAVPESIGGVEVGSIVRVPLGGRRVRGWVTAIEALGDRPADGLREILSRSGDVPIFDEKLLGVLRWAAIHYVAPMAGLLPRAGPPNLPRGSRRSRDTAWRGRSSRSRMITGSGPWHDLLIDTATEHGEDGVIAVVVPSVRDVEDIGTGLAAALGERVYRATSSLSAREVTRAWRQAGHPGTVLVGTREIAAWHLPLLRIAVVVEPGRRTLKAKQTPTLHARDLMRRRSQIERFSLISVGAVPPAESIAAGAVIEKPAARSWPLVEVVGREEEGPGAGIVLERTRRAIRSIALRSGNVFVHVPRRGYAPALRCVRCGTMRRCLVCGAGPDRGDTCRRCGSPTGPCVECGSARFQALGAGVGRVVEDLGRSLDDLVGPVDRGSRVQVGTERDLPPAGTQDLAVAIEPDALWLAPNYRAEEEALRILARVAGTVRRGSGRRLLVQTADPQHRVVAALRTGDATDVMRSIVDERADVRLPPSGSLIAVEVRGDRSVVDFDLGRAVKDEAAVFGPAPAGDGWRWLIQGVRAAPGKGPAPSGRSGLA